MSSTVPPDSLGKQRAADADERLQVRVALGYTDIEAHRDRFSLPAAEPPIRGSGTRGRGLGAPGGFPEPPSA